MDRPPGLRELKKQRTRHTLIRTGLRLFTEQGFAATTVAQIAAAAEVAPATFFTYFPSKEDLVFAQQPERARTMHDTIAARAAGETLPEVLRRALHTLLDSEQWIIESDHDLTRARARLVVSEPALRAAALRRLFDLQDELAGSLSRAFPDLDDVAAHAVIGSVFGATISAAMAVVRRDDDPAEITRAAAKAAEIALANLRS